MLNKIKRVVEQNPNKIAYKVNDKSITYKELWDSANKYAELLKKQGDAPVIIYGHKDINVIISILSCIISSRAYVPVGLCTPLFRVKQIIEMTKSNLVMTDEKIEIDNVDCLSLEKLNRFENNEIKEINNDIVYIIFTSGSTGIPKGVPISKSNLNNFIDWLSSLKPLCDYKDVKVLNQASFSFDLSVADLYYSLCNGHTLVAVDKDIQEDYEGLFKVLSEVDVAVMTPTFMKLCLLNDDFNSNNYPNFKCVYFCGEELETKTARKIFERFPNIEILNAYGPTEATSAVSAINITKEMTENLKLLPAGVVGNFATEIEIVDEEIILKDKSVFGGYLGNCVGGYYKEGNVNCYKTGDIGYIEDGNLYCKGRRDSQVKYKGYRIELNDIEYNINSIKDVKECAVIAKYNDNQKVKTIKAFVVVDNNQTEEYVKKELEKLIPNYMMPKTIKIIDKLPINNNGKIDRKALSEL